MNGCSTIPGCLELLRKAVLAEGSQAAVAAKLKYSPATVSRVLAGTYDGDMASICEAIATIYGGKTMEQNAIPDGYMQNSLGHLVPIESIKEIDLARDEFVRGVIVRVKEFSDQLEKFKQQLADDIQAFVDLSAEKYDVKAGSVSGRWIPLKTFDGKYSIVREISDVIDFDERLQIAKVLVDECLNEWGQTADSKVKTMLADAFQTNKKGRVNVQKVLGLRKYKFDDPRWKKAMEAIADSLTVVGTRPYYRMHERDDKGKYQQLNLDFSRV
jgi:hypothetical protein